MPLKCMFTSMVVDGDKDEVEDEDDDEDEGDDEDEDDEKDGDVDGDGVDEGSSMRLTTSQWPPRAADANS